MNLSERMGHLSHLDKLQLGTGCVLIVLGLVGFIGSGASSVTALIPSFFGLLFVILGLLGGRTYGQWTRVATAGVALSVLGLAGTVTALPDLPALFRGDDLERPWAVGVQSAMVVILVVHLAVALRFYLARRAAN